jgi:hypothetical protein
MLVALATSLKVEPGHLLGDHGHTVPAPAWSVVAELAAMLQDTDDMKRVLLHLRSVSSEDVALTARMLARFNEE